jgi:phospholipase C
MVLPWAKVNYVDHSLTDQSSILRFIEDNWNLNCIDGPSTRDPGNGLRKAAFIVAPQKQSFDVVTRSFDNMFDDERHLERFILNPVTGAVIRDDRR